VIRHRATDRYDIQPGRGSGERPPQPQCGDQVKAKAVIKLGPHLLIDRHVT
jgi:hypothetical protein